jgi:predicted acyl esterase
LGYARDSLGRRASLLLAALACGLAWAGSAGAAGTDERVVMSDGVEIATTVYVPDGAAPAGGWPGVLMLHGLGGKRQDFAALADAYRANGYAVLAYDARGHGESGGVVDVNGPAEIQDVFVLWNRLGSRPDVNRDRIGGWGISYGGGALLRATGQGAPFAALQVYETWSDLYSALLPQNLAKSGVILGFLSSISRPSPWLAQVRDAAVTSSNLDALRTASHERSSLHLLGPLHTPVYWAQGKRDYAFDIDQAARAFRVLGGPKRLYVGNLGHAPSTFASDDAPYFLERGRLWFDRFLKGMPNGIDTGPSVEVAATPFAPATVKRFAGLPPTRTLAMTAKAARPIGAQGKAVLTSPRLPRAVNTFGSATVTLRASTTGRWPHLVAVLSARKPDGTEVVLGTGGVPTRSLGRRPSRVTIRLSSWSAPVPRGSRLRLTLASTSLAQSASTPVYLLAPPNATAVTVRDVSWRVPILR